ncbi:hypothetical protein V497_06186, partial [Pseudogymnoascus sp. VKM F-4516 (FW-969)]
MYSCACVDRPRLSSDGAAYLNSRDRHIAGATDKATLAQAHDKRTHYNRDPAMTTKGINSKSPTIRRILREAAELSSTPSPDFHAVPTETDLFTWHFTLRGPPSSAYSSGIYHGRIVLPPTY